MPTRLYKPLALAVFTAFSVPSLAVQVNDMSVFSAAGQPLRMDIELTDVGVNPAGTLVRVASAEEHERLGVTRPAWADSVRFKLLQEQAGKLVARATTSAPVADEFVTFLIYIRADGQSRLQQVAAKAGGQAIASSSASAVAASAPSKPKPAPAPKVVSLEPAATVDAPAPAPTPVAKPAPAAKVAAAPAPAAASAAAPAPAADTAEGIAQERKALTQGLDAAKAQVTDLESQLKALDAREAALKGVAAPADAAAPAPDATTTDTAAAAPEAAPAAEAAPAPADDSKSANDGDSFSPVPLFIILGIFGLLAGLSHLFRRRTDALPSDVISQRESSH